jgi:hypothetical protein
MVHIYQLNCFGRTVNCDTDNSSSSSSGSSSSSSSTSDSSSSLSDGLSQSDGLSFLSDGISAQSPSSTSSQSDGILALYKRQSPLDLGIPLEDTFNEAFTGFANIGTWVENTSKEFAQSNILNPPGYTYYDIKGTNGGTDMPVMYLSADSDPNGLTLIPATTTILVAWNGVYAQNLVAGSFNLSWSYTDSGNNTSSFVPYTGSIVLPVNAKKVTLAITTVPNFGPLYFWAVKFSFAVL